MANGSRPTANRCRGHAPHPNQNGQIRPVIIKLRNNSVKSAIMRKRAPMKAMDEWDGDIYLRCPLSSSLFIICIEYLSHHIQSNKHIKGISLEPDEEIIQSLFADDATYFLNDNYDSFHNLIESLTLYGMTSGLKLNKSTLKQSNVLYKKEMKFNWTSDEATTLGITFTNNEKDTNWFERSIKYVDQLYDYRIKDFYSFDNICYIYGIPSNNFLKYFTLIKSRPIHIKI
ncbi:hypothetical protein DPMN_104126 [Dreissena polymorpha]|uniref:Reverse transcriptase domain-containing protein n=1 Tax=Dreissena polymorpha TaxID=45954 RepID=A0A9D4JZS7_DREPO|nr:hypothetical protein DPMN_104126 [Dreissena polymorpha]